jgi:hypothetical protein
MTELGRRDRIFAEVHKTEVGAYVTEHQAELDRQYAAYKPSSTALRISGLVAERQARESQIVKPHRAR